MIIVIVVVVVVVMAPREAEGEAQGVAGGSPQMGVLGDEGAARRGRGRGFPHLEGVGDS